MSEHRERRRPGRPTRAERDAKRALLRSPGRTDLLMDNLSQEILDEALALIRKGDERLRAEGAPRRGNTERYAAYCDEYADAFLLLIASGWTRRRAVTALGLSPSAVTRWRATIEGFVAKYDQACAQRADVWADDAIEDLDKEINYAADGASVEVAHQRLRFDAKKWLMGKHNRRYSDKTIVEGGDRPVRTVNSTMSAEEAAEVWAEQVRELQEMERGR